MQQNRHDEGVLLQNKRYFFTKHPFKQENSLLRRFKRVQKGSPQMHWGKVCQEAFNTVSNASSGLGGILR